MIYSLTISTLPDTIFFNTQDTCPIRGIKFQTLIESYFQAQRPYLLLVDPATKYKFTATPYHLHNKEHMIKARLEKGCKSSSLKIHLFVFKQSYLLGTYVGEFDYTFLPPPFIEAHFVATYHHSLPTVIQNQLQIADTYAHYSNYSQSLSWLYDAFQQDPRSIPILDKIASIVLHRQAFNEPDYDFVLTSLLEALQEPVILGHLGHLLLSGYKEYKKNSKEAQTLLNIALVHHPYRFEFLYDLGSLYLKSESKLIRNYAYAQHYLEIAFTLKSDHKTLLTRLISACYLSAELDKLSKYLDYFKHKYPESKHIADFIEDV